MAAPPRPSFVGGSLLAANIYDTISEYISTPTRDAYLSAVELTSLVAPLMTTASDIQSVCHLWGVMFFMATTYHPSSPKHYLIVDLILEIRKCSAPPSQARFDFEKQAGCLFWVDLPMWLDVWNDFEFDAPIVPRKADRQSAPTLTDNRFLPGPWRNGDGTPMKWDAWASLNALGARVCSQTSIGLLAMKAHCALAEGLGEDKPAFGLDDAVPAAATWMLYAGKKIREDCQAGYEDDATGETKNGFSKERWEFWKKRFGDLADRKDLKRNTRAYAKQARDEMGRLESISTSSGQATATAAEAEATTTNDRLQAEAGATQSSPTLSRGLRVSDLIN